MNIKKFSIILVVLAGLIGACAVFVKMVEPQNKNVLVPKGMMIGVDRSSACLPVGYVLLFVDRRNRFGYFYFSKKKYGEAEYVFSIQNPHSITKTGKFTKPKWFSWQKKSIADRAICVDNNETPHFLWVENGVLFFAFGVVDRVSIVRREEFQDERFTTNKVDWYKVPPPSY